MHWRAQFFGKNDKNLGSWDLYDDKQDKYVPVVVTIKSFGIATVDTEQGEEKKASVRLAEFKKPMIMNKENFKRLQKKFRSPETKDYEGKQVLLQVETVKAFGDFHDALRFSAREIPSSMLKGASPKSNKEKLSGAELEKQIGLIKQGKSTPDRVKNVRDVSAEQLKKLNEAYEEYSKGDK